MFHVSVIATNATVVIYGILFGNMHPVVFISTCKWIETFHVSVIATNATVVYVIYLMVFILGNYIFCY